MDLTLSSSELTFLRRIGPVIYKTWGYRTTASPNFEDQTHNHSYGISLQHYSDVVFRNLYNVCSERWNTLFRSDTVSFLNRVHNLRTYYREPDTPAKITAIVARYLRSSTECEEAFKELVRYEEIGASLAMLFIVRAAKALCFIASGEYTDAYDTFVQLRNHLHSDTVGTRITPQKKTRQSKYKRTDLGKT